MAKIFIIKKICIQFIINLINKFLYFPKSLYIYYMKNINDIMYKVLEKIIESKIFELALKRKDAINKIKSYDDTLAEHIIKCFVFK